ncbi:phospholipase-like protein [Tanacetum coccineum]
MDVVRVCLLIVDELVFMGKEDRNCVPKHLVSLVEDFDKWDDYPWGEYIHGMFPDDWCGVVNYVDYSIIDGCARNPVTDKDKQPTMAEIFAEIRALRKEVASVKVDDERIAKLERLVNQIVVNKGNGGSSKDPISTCSRPDMDNVEVAGDGMPIGNADGNHDIGIGLLFCHRGLGGCLNDPCNHHVLLILIMAKLPGDGMPIGNADGNHDIGIVLHTAVIQGFGVSSNDPMSTCSLTDMDNGKVACDALDSGEDNPRFDVLTTYMLFDWNIDGMTTMSCLETRKSTRKSIQTKKSRLTMSLDSPYGQQASTTTTPPKTRSQSVNGDFIAAPDFEEDVYGAPKIRSINELMTLEVFVEQLSRPHNCKKEKVTLPDGFAKFIKMQDPPEYRFPWGYQDIAVTRAFWLGLACLDSAKDGWLHDSIGKVSSGVVYFSVNEPKKHWCLAELHISNGVVTFYDSLGSVCGNRRPWWRTMKRNLPQQLTLYLNQHGVLKSKGISVESYEIKYMFSKVVEQANLYGDCGVWVCIFYTD